MLRVRNTLLKLATAAVMSVTIAVSFIVPASAYQTANDVYTIAGTGASGYTGDTGPATSATMNTPIGMAIDSSNNLYVADMSNEVVREIAATSHVQFGISMTAGDIYTIAGNGTTGYLGDGGAATSAQLSSPWGIFVDAQGNLIIADSGNNRIREVAASNETQFGIAMTADDIYTIAGNGTSGHLGVGGAATSAEVGNPRSVFEDANGDLYLAQIVGSVIEEVPSTTNAQYGQAMTADDIYDVAGDGTSGFSGDNAAATSAELNSPCDVNVDGSGNIYIADQINNRVREVAATTGVQFGISMTANDIYTLVGTGTAGFTGDGSVATAAEVNQVNSVRVDVKGNLYLSDYANNRIREVAASSSTQFGVAMTANDIYTIAGTGTAGYTGNGGPALLAELDAPGRLVMDAGGDLYLTDELSDTVSELAAYSNRSILPATFAISSGSLAFVSAPGNFTFTPLTLSGQNQTSSASQSLDISDASGSGNGWDVTVSATQFTAGSQTLPYADFSVLSAPGVACDVNSGCAQATFGALYPYTLSAATTKLVSVNALTGMGDQTLTIPWTANITSGSYSGTYTSTWTVSLISGP